jgi:adenylosuccinate synthase
MFQNNKNKSFTSVVGLQWGDEGKGKIVDYLADRADLVVRFHGGDNAGHTIEVDGKVFKLSLLPSGIIRGKRCFIGSGVVINIQSLISEIELVRSQGIGITSQNLAIADNASVILDLYKEVDAINESALGGAKIGTTKKGIGIAYSDKAMRRAIRICDLFDDSVLEDCLKRIFNYHLSTSFIGLKDLPSYDVALASIKMIREKIKEFVVPFFDFTQKAKGNILFEGAQGFGLDINYGTYPYVTSSSTVCGSIFTGSGFGLTNINDNIGVLKAYATRVGEGPFPTEDNGSFGEALQSIGQEVGTVTKRRRRCGALDLVFAKQAARLCGVNQIALTKLDVLDGFDSIPVCTSYTINGKNFDYIPSSRADFANIVPNYQYFEGWSKQAKTENVKTFNDLPQNAVAYIKFIEDFLEIPISIVSTGKDREDTILR